MYTVLWNANNLHIHKRPYVNRIILVSMYFVFSDILKLDVKKMQKIVKIVKIAKIAKIEKNCKSNEWQTKNSS